MRKLISILAVVAFALPLAGCLQHTYVIGAGAPGGEVVYKHWHHHWLFGLIRPNSQLQLDLDKLCPSGNAIIDQETSFANGVVDALTAFIYRPTTVTVTCASGEGTETASLELTEEEAVEIASDPRFEEMVRRLAPERQTDLEVALAGR